MKAKTMNNTKITIEAVKEAIDFINKNWNFWEGDFEMLMANVISDSRVSSYDVRHLLKAIVKGEHIEGLEDIVVNKQGLNYIIKVMGD
tara:strand:+ start:863 stop:1126 length:264 start_codon:yes stop_codon:yes gene_type:complete